MLLSDLLCRPVVLARTAYYKKFGDKTKNKPCLKMGNSFDFKDTNVAGTQSINRKIKLCNFKSYVQYVIFPHMTSQV